MNELSSFQMELDDIKYASLDKLEGCYKEIEREISLLCKYGWEELIYSDLLNVVIDAELFAQTLVCVLKDPEDQLHALQAKDDLYWIRWEILDYAAAKQEWHEERKVNWDYVKSTVLGGLDKTNSLRLRFEQTFNEALKERKRND